MGKVSKIKLGVVFVLSFAMAVSVSQLGSKSAYAAKVLKISHQWAGGTIDKGDYRDRFCRVFAKKVEDRTNGELKFRVYPSATLYKAKEQYDALVKGGLDITLYPLAYKAGKIPELSITHMPCIVKNYEQGLRWRDAPIGEEIARLCKENGVTIISWTYARGGIGSKSKLIKLPDDLKGVKIRAADKMFNSMLLTAGASIVSMPSSEAYFALQTGVLDAMMTSNSSFLSYHLYEQIKYYNSTRERSIFHMFVPLLISNTTFKNLSPKQQKIVMEVGREMQKWAMDEGDKEDELSIKTMEQKGVNVYDMTVNDFNKWRDFSEKTAWEKFIKEVKGGKELVDMATSVK